MWRDFIVNLTDAATYGSPASAADLAEAEKDLAIIFPGELRELLSESDGIKGAYGLNVVWPLARIQKDNLEFRTRLDFRQLYMPFDCLLFFGDAGDGDQFAYAILDGEIRRDDVYRWCHETDSREWAASSLRQYLERWATGRLG
jgi:hypothetical protein